MSVVGEFRRILGETTARLRESEFAAAGRFAEELEAVVAEEESVTNAAAAVLDLVGSRERQGATGRGESSPEETSPTTATPRERDLAPERLGAATEHLTAICKVILGRS